MESEREGASARDCLRRLRRRLRCGWCTRWPSNFYAISLFVIVSHPWAQSPILENASERKSDSFALDPNSNAPATLLHFASLSKDETHGAGEFKLHLGGFPPQGRHGQAGELSVPVVRKGVQALDARWHCRMSIKLIWKLKSHIMPPSVV